MISLNRLSPGVQYLLTHEPVAGKDGKDGVDGKDGADGLDGVDGTAGLDSDTPRGSRRLAARLAPGAQRRRRRHDPVRDPAPPRGRAARRERAGFTAGTGKTVVAYLPLPAGAAAAFATGPHPRLSELTTASCASLSNGVPAATSDIVFQMEVLGANVAGAGNGYTTLSFEPSSNGKTTSGAWQRWNVRAGKVWTSRAHLAGVGTAGECGAGAPCTLSRFMELNPKAEVRTVKLKIGQNNGTGWTGFSGWVDDVRLGFDGLALRWDLGA